MLCVVVNAEGGDLYYDGGCFFKGANLLYSSVSPGGTLTIDGFVTMVRFATDPYVKAYSMSKDGIKFYDINEDTSTSLFIKWLVFLSGVM